MPFTKAQRLKGLKKQLRNLGYDVVNRGGSAPAADVEEIPVDDEMAGQRGEHTAASWKAKESGGW